MNASNYFRLLATAALIDGELSEKERQLLVDGATILGLPPEQANRITNEVQQSKSLSIPPIAPQEREQVLLTVARVLASDGQIVPEERKFFERLGAVFQVPAGELNRMLAVHMKAALEEAAKNSEKKRA